MRCLSRKAGLSVASWQVLGTLKRPSPGCVAIVRAPLELRRGLGEGVEKPYKGSAPEDGFSR